jgi:uncharacterized metal-binding protein YceD (DUF177 family)
MMKHSREFEIAWMGLKPGVHEYQYELGDRFFEAMEAPAEYSHWNVAVKLRFERQVSFFRLHFDVGGTVTVACDRCGDPFPLQLWDEFDLLVKLSGEDEATGEEDDADVVFIPRSETVLNVAEWLYEFSLLSVPLQRIHPPKSNGEAGCNPQALNLLGQLSESDTPDDADTPDAGDSGTDSRWAGLKAFKDKNFEAEDN